ncbi:FecR family protein [Stenotrophomonas acidaminiphila]
MERDATPRDALFARAAAWVARLDAADCTRAEREAFEDWLAADPARVRAWAEAERLHARAAALRDDPWLRAGARHVVRRPLYRRPLFGLAAAAALCLAVGTGWALVTDGRPAPHTYVNSGLAPQRQVLEDGSVAVLDARTTLTARFGWRRRDIELQQGRMQLQVAPSRKAMRVEAGNSTLRDIGTTFQVELLDDGRVDIALLDGALEIASRGAQGMHRPLQPGQQLQVLPSGRIEPAQALAPQAEAWPQGRLRFDATPLPVAIARMNRYTATPLVIGDPALAPLAVSGTFAAGDQAALLSALELGWSVTAHARADGALELRGTR